MGGEESTGESTDQLSSANVRRKLGKLVEYLVYMNHSETRRIHGRRSYVESHGESFLPSLEIVLRATREDFQTLFTIANKHQILHHGSQIERELPLLGAHYPTKSKRVLFFSR
jgi:hypothetical protein